MQRLFERSWSDQETEQTALGRDREVGRSL